MEDNIPFPWKILSKKLGQMALNDRPDWTSDHVKSCWKLFHAYQTAKNATRTNEHAWEMCWHGWVLRQRTEVLNVKSKAEGWWSSASGIEDKGKELGLQYNPQECFAYFKMRVFDKAGNGPWRK